MLQVLSLGAGVQSTALLALVLAGEHERPALVVFCDTGSERPATIRTAERAEGECITAGIPFVTARPPIALHVAYRDEPASLPIPAVRTCTTAFKRTPIHHAIKAHLGLNPSDRLPPGSVCQWLGISTDERHRARPSPLKWATSRFPLLELHMSRADCAAALVRLGWPGVEPSGCFCCPFQSLRGWSELRLKHPELFAVAREMEAAKIEAQGGPGFLPSGTLARLDFDATLEAWGLVVDEPLNQSGRPVPACEHPDGGCFT